MFGLFNKSELSKLKSKYPGAFQNISAGSTTVRLCIEDDEDYQPYMDESFLNFDRQDLKHLLPVHKKIKETGELSGNERLSNDSIILAMENILGYSTSSNVNDEEIDRITEESFENPLEQLTRSEKLSAIGSDIKNGLGQRWIDNGVIELLHPVLDDADDLYSFIEPGLANIGHTMRSANGNEIRAILEVMDGEIIGININ